MGVIYWLRKITLIWNSLHAIPTIKQLYFPVSNYSQLKNYLQNMKRIEYVMSANIYVCSRLEIIIFLLLWQTKPIYLFSCT